MHERAAEVIRNAGFGDSFGGPHASVSQGDDQNSELGQIISQATENISQLTTTTQASVDSLTANTEAITQGFTSNKSGTSAVTGAVSQAASGLLSGGGILGGGLLGGGLGLLFDGISSLFGAGSSQPAPLVQYEAPASQNFELASSQGSLGDAVYDANGQPRSSDLTQLAFTGIQGGNAGSAGGSAASGANGQTGNASNQSITVQVQAMDSQSFLDRSGDIATAVRQAMLNMHSINDVVTDL